MFVAGIDAHATYSVIAIVSKTGELVHKPVRIKNSDVDHSMRFSNQASEPPPPATRRRSRPLPE